MTNMTFEEAKNYYEILRNKPLAENERYKELKEKYHKMYENANNALSEKMATLSNDVIVISNTSSRISIVLEGKTVYDTSFYFSIHELNNMKKAINDALLSLIGWWMGNYHRNFTFEDLIMVTSKAKEVSEKITDEFVSEYKELTKEYLRVNSIVEGFREALRKRRESAYYGYQLLVESWKRTEGLNDGTQLIVTTGPRWERNRNVNGHKEGKNGTIVYFTNNTKTNISNIEWYGSFRYNHPEYNQYSFN